MLSRSPAAACALIFVGTLTAKPAQAFVLLASYGRFEQDAKQNGFTTIEASQAKGGLGDFELANINHGHGGKTVADSLQLVYRGLGFDFEVLRLNFDIGYFFSLDKYALDEIDYGISRSIVGGGLSLDFNLVQLHGFSRSFIPTGSQKARIDSFTFTFNPYYHQQTEAGIAVTLGSLTLSGDAGRLDHLRGRYDILGDNFEVSAPAVSYAKAALLIQGNNHTALRLEAHQLLGKQDKQTDFHKFVGTAMHHDAYDGGSLGLGLAF